MNYEQNPRPPAWLAWVSWLPVATYFIVKYAVIGRDEITSRQTWLLIAAVIMAEVALWQYRKQFKARSGKDVPNDQDARDGTD